MSTEIAEIETATEEELDQELLREVDKFLADISHQTIVEQPKVVDFTLDLRKIITKRSN